MVRVEPMTAVNAKQVGFGYKKHQNKAQGDNNFKYFRELGENLNVGDKINVADVFNSGDKVKVTGTSKGKGFAGVVKRHGFKGGPKTHGQSNRQRHPGSIGQTTTPGRVYRGKRMAGHMGNVQRTVTGLEIFAVKPEENLLLVKGLVPGNVGGLVKISK
jgi:large subunit ribosomal protein L3